MSEFREICRLTGHQGDVNSVEFCPVDTNLLASCGGSDGSLRIWDTRTHRTAFSSPLDPESQAPLSASNLKFAPDGKGVFVTSGSSLHLFDLREISGTKSGQGPILKSQFSADVDDEINNFDICGNFLALPMDSGHVFLADAATCQPLGGISSCASIGRDPLAVALIRPSSVQPVLGPSVSESLTAESSANSALLSARNLGQGPKMELLAGGYDCSLSRWDVSSRRPLGAPVNMHSLFSVLQPAANQLVNPAYLLAAQFDPATVATRNEYVAVSTGSGGVMVLQYVAEKLRSRTPVWLNTFAHGSMVNALGWVLRGSKKRSLLVSAGADSKLCLWDPWRKAAATQDQPSTATAMSKKKGSQRRPARPKPETEGVEFSVEQLPKPLARLDLPGNPNALAVGQGGLFTASVAVADVEGVVTIYDISDS